jgi:hypothetical protein
MSNEVKVETVTVGSTERVIISGDNNLVTSVQNQQVVAQNEAGTVVVTGLLGPVAYAGSVSNLADVNLDNLQEGSLLIFSQTLGQWLASNLLEQQTMNGGFF